MALRRIRKYGSGKHLLRALTDNPELPAFIPSLSATSLGKLVQQVGVLDSAELIEHSTPEQLTTLIDESVWKAATPGKPDQFDPEEFLAWLEVLLEIGEEFLVDRLRALDEDFLVMALVRYLKVNDVDKQVLDASANEEFIRLESTADLQELYGTFEVSPRFEDEWDTIQPLLVGLHCVDPAYLDALLTRCCLPDAVQSIRGTGSMAMDAGAAHEERRRREGFLPPDSAAAFLRSARVSPLAELLGETEYDLETQFYFRRAMRSAMDAAYDRNGTGPRRIGSRTPERDPEEEVTPAPDPERLQELEGLLAEVELDVLATQTRRLAGPDAQGPATNALQRALQSLAEEVADCLPQRMNEAAYLSNLLMVGVRLDGAALTHQEAASAVIAVCNLGFEFAPETDLHRMPGLVGLFRIGWHLLHGLPTETIETLRRLLASEPVQARMGSRAWIAEDIRQSLGAEEIDADLRAGRMEGVRDALRMLSLLFEGEAVERILGLVDYLPVDREISNEGSGDPGQRFIETEQGLVDVQIFLANLGEEMLDFA